MINDFRNTNYPNLSELFATNEGAKVKPTDGERATGFKEDHLLPAVKLNWLLDQAYQNSKPALQSAFSSFRLVDSPLIAHLSIGDSPRVHGITRFEVATDASIWCIMYSKITHAVHGTLWSIDGDTWTIGEYWTPAYAGSADDALCRKAMGVTESGLVVITYPKTGDARIVLGYSADMRVTPFTEVDVYTGAAFAKCLAVENSGNRIMIGDSSGLVHTAETATSPWTTRTVTSGIAITDITHVADNTWLATTESGDVYLTTNAGSTWALSAFEATGSGAYKSLSLEVGTTGRAVLMSRHYTTGELAIWYSDNYSDWVKSTLQVGVWNFTEEAVGSVSNLGNGVWVATGSLRDSTLTISPTYVHYLFVSVDNGATWCLGNQLSNEADTFSDGIDAVGFSGSEMLALGVSSAIKGLNNYA